MTKRISTGLTIIAFAFMIANFSACSKSDPAPAPSPVDPCAGKTIVITPTSTAAVVCGAGGSISVTAAGSSGFSYKLNSTGTYQAAGTFSNVAAGDYTLFAKDGAGCEKSVAVTVPASGAAGTQFSAVKTLVAAKCQSCHNNTLANGGMNFQVECNIITNKTRIKVRAVDEGTMPQSGPLTLTEKNIISNWITGGGGYAN
jgi:hypothetical protein